MIQLKREDLEQMKNIAEEAYPYECCGVLAGTENGGMRTVAEVIPAENHRTDSPENRYLITADFMRQIENRLQNTKSSIVGFFHSHPDVPARPSTYDKEHAWPWYAYVIVSVRRGRAVEVYNWKLRNDRSEFDAERIDVL